MQKKIIIAAVIALALIGGGAVYYFGIYNVNRMPDLDRPFTPAARFPESVREDSKTKVASAVAELKENPELISRWLQIAVYRKGADDYAGAEEIWLYLTKHWPNDTVAYGNLADLYQNYLNKPTKAETYLRKLIEIAPDNIAAYRNLYDLYRTKLNDPAAGQRVLQEGLQKNPEAIDLIIPIAIYERDHGELAAAREHFVQAKGLAEASGNTGLAGLLDGEIGKLPPASQ